MSSFGNKTVVITGGAGGIGLAVGKLLAGDGAESFMADLQEEALQTAVNSIGGSKRVSYQVADVTRPEEVKNYLAGVIERYGVINCFLNNADALVPLRTGLASCSHYSLNSSLNIFRADDAVFL
ncbi:MAG: SDR family oxidoreductase [Porticoccaceae bacterium]|nr:SDR family oxidoreductase [Porticoccaceae bacterium]